MKTIYDYEDLNTSELGIEIPSWINQNISTHTVAAIIQDGCGSGAYMPAVMYAGALATMGKHGNDVLNYITEQVGTDYKRPPKSKSWGGMAVYYLSMAVELWASSVEDEILEKLEEQSQADEEATFLSEGELLIDSFWGVHVPKNWAERYGETWLGFDQADLGTIQIGPAHPEYWNAWEMIYQNAYHIDDDGQKWGLLENDGGVWAVKLED